MQVTIPRTTVTVPGPAALLRSWRWPLLLLPALVALLAVTLLSSPAGPATATGGGNSITSPDAGGNSFYDMSLALDASGNPVVSYRDYNNYDLKVLHCNDANCAGGGESITSPDTGGQVGDFSSLALDAAGKPVVSYMDFTNYDLKVLHCNDANCAGGDESITSPDTGGSVGYYPSLALDTSGNPVVSYFDGTNNDLKVLHCNDANCVGGDESITSPDAGGVVGPDTSLALDASGNPVVSYNDYGNSDLKVLHCNDANCAGGDESITSPDTGGDVGRYTSLALDAGGSPVVSYRDETNEDLKVVHCNDANCAGGGESITSPDTVGNVGGYTTSLALDAAGNPVVSYLDITNLDLKVLHCNDANCAGGGESITSPDTGDVSSYSSLALDAAGNPVVSYPEGFPSAALKVLHCVDVNCTGVKPTPTPTPTSTATPTPTPVPPSQINVTNLGQYALPKTCFEVRNATQILFDVCDNDFAGAPMSNPVCQPDGICNDEDPAEGPVKVSVIADSYLVKVIPFAPSAPQHTVDPNTLACSPGVGGSCSITFINTPKTRPWHPWDITGPVGGLPDGKVRVDDILAVVTHYFQDKP